jgi:hypothetical protein
MRHSCLRGPMSKCRGCIEEQAMASARMRGETDPAPWRDEAKVILEGWEQYERETRNPKWTSQEKP